jgi:hypothetical protein
MLRLSTPSSSLTSSPTPRRLHLSSPPLEQEEVVLAVLLLQEEMKELLLLLRKSLRKKRLVLEMLLICSEVERRVVTIRSIVTNKKSFSMTLVYLNVSYFDFHSRMI